MSTAPAPLNVKQAITAAIGALSEMLGDKIVDVRLEEVEYVDSEKQPVWEVTLSFRRTDAASTPAEAVARLSGGRDYKTIRLDANSGNFMSMKIRQLR